MKKVILIIISISSCMPIDNRSEMFIVTSVKQVDRTTDEVCFFYLNNLIRQKLEVYDTINKWHIGDTLILKKNN